MLTSLHCIEAPCNYEYGYNYNYIHTILHHTSPYYTVCCTALNTRLHHATPHSTPFHSTPFPSTPVHSIPLHSIPLNPTTLHYTALITAKATTTSMLLYATLGFFSLHCTTLVTPPQTQLELHHTSHYSTPRLQFHHATATTTAAPYHPTSSSCG